MVGWNLPNLCKNEGLAAIVQIPAERRSNSWREQEQHGIWRAPRPCPIRLRDCRRAPIVPVPRPGDALHKDGTQMSSSRTIPVNGIDMFLLEQGEGPLVVLCHGWPELSYSWRHQIPALAAAGFHVVAPDMRGFGRTTAPSDIEAYTIIHNVGDMVALVAALGETRAVIVGHDWGAPVAWHAAMMRPDVFTKVAGLSVPPFVRGRSRPLETLQANGITNFYWQYFQTPGVAEAEFEHHVANTMRTVLAGRGGSDPAAHQFVEAGKGFLGDGHRDRPLPPWLTEADLAYF